MTDPKQTQAVLRKAKRHRDQVIGTALTSYWSTALLLMVLAVVFANIPWTTSTPLAETQTLVAPLRTSGSAEQEGHDARETDDRRLP